jgi:hypothetical protein
VFLKQRMSQNNSPYYSIAYLFLRVPNYATEVSKVRKFDKIMVFYNWYAGRHCLPLSKYGK